MKANPRIIFLCCAALMALMLACSFVENLGGGGQPTNIPDGMGVVPTTEAAKTPAVVASPAVDETLPPGGCPENLGKIAFTYDPRDRDTVHYGIYLMGADGSGRVRLSGADEINHREPAWSPERCRIAFTALTSPSNEDIYVMTADGKSIRQLTSDPARDMFPDWSPDGKQIVFVSYRNGGIRNLFLMNADGSQQRQLTDNPGEYSQWVQWSPKGDLIAFTYNPGGDKDGGNVYVICPDGTGLRQVTPSAGALGDLDLAWAPDGEKLYFTSNRSHHVEIWEINLDGSGLRQVSNLSASVAIDHSLRVSPDGKRLAFYGIGQEGVKYATDIYVLNSDGSGLDDISLSPGKEEWLDW